MLLTVKVPSTVKLPVICTSLLGITTLPVPWARNSKLLLEVVVVIILSSIFISSIVQCRLYLNLGLQLNHLLL